MDHSIEVTIFGKPYKFSGQRGTRGAGYYCLLLNGKVNARLDQSPWNDLWMMVLSVPGMQFKVDDCPTPEDAVEIVERNMVNAVEGLASVLRELRA